VNLKPGLLLVALAATLLIPVHSPASASVDTGKEAILAVISRMEAAWNRGDFRGYMEGFANPDVIFVSRGQFQKDWQGTLDHYVRDYGASEATRGRLRFFDIQIDMLAPDAAQLISRYQLDRPENPQDGINTRLMRKRGDKWVIALNHVSPREKERDPTLTEIKRTDLQREDLSTPGREAIQVLVEFAPGTTFPAHSHPGEELVYVTEGSLEYAVADRPPVTLDAGDTLFIPAGAVHAVRNVGKGNGAELATYIVEKGKPLLVLAE